MAYENINGIVHIPYLPLNINGATSNGYELYIDDVNPGGYKMYIDGDLVDMIPEIDSLPDELFRMDE